MIPPSIVLIIYGLITETSIKALFTGAFVPGFMLAMMFILYIIVRTQLNPEQAPLPEPKPGDPQGAEKWALFGAFLSIITAGFSFALFLLIRSSSNIAFLQSHCIGLLYLFSSMAFINKSMISIS